MFADNPAGSEYDPSADESAGRSYLLHQANAKETNDPDARAVDVTRLLERVASIQNLSRSLLNVARNKGAPGVDRQSVQEVVSDAPEFLAQLRHALIAGTYLPGDIRRVWIPKPGGGDWRQLEFPATTNGIPRFFRADPDHEGMVKDQQVRRLVKLKKNEKTLTMAAAKAGMSRKTARKYLKSGKLPSQCQPERYWRTRSDPFESVWPEVKEILKRSPTVEAKAVFDHLCRQQEGAFQQGQLRTLQRRIKQWKAEYGEAKEVMFPQKYQPGHQAQSDFTFMGRLGVTIQGQPFPHLLYHFVLAYSNWEATTLCFSESFESLSLGLQNALWELGSLPEEHRTDRLSAAVKNLQRDEFTERYQGLLRHFGMRSSRTQAGKAHENGDVEQAHHRLKRAIEQELLLRCSRDFASREEYEGFVAMMVARRNAARQKRLGEELAVMRPLPARRLDDFTRQWVRVSPSSTIRVRHNTYSVNSPVNRRASASAGVGGSGGSLLRRAAPGTDAALARRRQASH